MNKFELYLSGSSDKAKVDKTTKDWISELFTSLFRAKKAVWIFFALYGGTFLIYYFPSWGISVHPAIIVIQKIMALLLAPVLFVAIIIFIIRAIGLLGTFLHPEIKANDVNVSESGVKISLQNGRQEFFDVKAIRRVIVVYNARGFLLRTAEKTNTYSVRLEPAEIEKRFDSLRGLGKEVSTFQSREGDIRSVYYTDPAFPDKKWDR